MSERWHVDQKSELADYVADVLIGGAFLGMMTYTIMAIMAVIVVNMFGILPTTIIHNDWVRAVAEIAALVCGFFTCRVIGKWLWLLSLL
jgi:hypothetical protein